MSHRLNLARRPFVNTRPVNIFASVLAAVTVILFFVSFQTVSQYFRGSEKTREAIAGIRREISTLEAAKEEAQRQLDRHDLEELSLSAEDAGWIARKRAFSWTRFLTRLEKVLPADVRVVSVQLSRQSGEDQPVGDMSLTLQLVSRDPNGLPKVIRAFYSSEFFDEPKPSSEVGPKEGIAEGTQISLTVAYRDAGGTKP